MDTHSVSNDQSETKTGKHTSVLYVHGMGEQRRYEEVSRLVESLDKYSRTVNQGIISNIRARLEPSRKDQDDDVSYIRTVCHSTGPESSKAKSVRFYEMYWAPICAGGNKVQDVLIWLGKQLFTPFKMIFSTWRSRQRIRRAALLANETANSTQRISPEHMKIVHRLLELYDEFDRPDTNAEYPKGRFRDFVAYIRKTATGVSDNQGTLILKAKQWRSSFIRQEFFTAFILLTLFLMVAIIGVAAAWLLFHILHLFAAAPIREFITRYLSEGFYDKIDPSWSNVIAILIAGGSALGIKNFLEKYVGDVQFWTTYEETDEKYSKRSAILNKGFDSLMHLLNDPECDRIVVVSHSLGTAIAADTLLHIGKYNRARNSHDPMSGPLPLEKITHLITIASPVDKIHYFFESYQAKYQRYRRVVEEIRGDIAEVPYAKNRKPHIHWINFWDKGDIISGPLESPANNRVTDLFVDNVHVTNYFFPAPGACHGGYFQNRSVIGVLFNIIFENAFAFSKAPLVQNKGYDYASTFLGPGKKWPFALGIFHGVMILAPWTALLGIASYLFSPSQALTQGIFGAFAAELLALVCGFLAHLKIGNLEPIKPVRENTKAG